jgi:hypothetical protein
LLSTEAVLTGAKELALALRALGIKVRLQTLEVGPTYDVLYETMSAVLAGVSEGEVEGLISAGSPKARAVWLALLASGAFSGPLFQVVGETVRRICLPAPPTPFKGAVGPLSEAVAATEADWITAALLQTGHNLSQTARLLQIDRNTLKRKMRQLGLGGNRS